MRTVSFREGKPTFQHPLHASEITIATNPYSPEHSIKMTCIQILRGWRAAGDDGMTQMVGMEMDELKSESKINNPPSIIHHTPSIIYYSIMENLWKKRRNDIGTVHPDLHGFANLRLSTEWSTPSTVGKSRGTRVHKDHLQGDLHLLFTKEMNHPLCHETTFKKTRLNLDHI